MVGLSEEGVDIQSTGNPFILAEFSPVVEGDGVQQVSERIQQGNDCIGDIVGGGRRDDAMPKESSGPVAKGHVHTRPLAPDYGVPFQIPEPDPLVHYSGPLFDILPIGYNSPIFVLARAFAMGTALPPQMHVQLAALVLVLPDVLVDPFHAHHVNSVQHAPAMNLFRAPFQHQFGAD